MRMYLVERELPGAGAVPGEQWAVAATRSCDVLRDMSDTARWIESFVTANRIYCVYEAVDENAIREHGRRGGFPVTSIHPIDRVIHPGLAARPSAALST